MPAYHYEALHANGDVAEGVVEATSRDDAVAQIRKSYEIVLSLDEVKQSVKDPFQKFRRLNWKSFALMCKQFSIILKAGMPLVQAVDLVASQVSDKVLKKMLMKVSEDIANGWSLAYSFSQEGMGFLPLTFVETIRAGEESGDLVKSFERMSTYYDRMTKTRAKAASAMVYPAFLMVVAAMVIIVIMTYAVPTFSATFASMGLKLPLPTRIVIAVSNFFNKYLWIVVCIITLLGFLLRLYGNTTKGQVKFSRAKLAIPIIGKITVMTSASQFAHTMSAMLSAGMPILNALDIASRSVSNAHLSHQLQDIIPSVESGKSLGSCMRYCKDLPPMLVHMTTMGETTGTMEYTLEVQGEYYDNEVDTLSARALSLLEPIIICIMAVIVVCILASIYLPLFSLYGAM